jgi:hypothetical protein
MSLYLHAHSMSNVATRANESPGFLLVRHHLRPVRYLLLLTFILALERIGFGAATDSNWWAFQAIPAVAPVPQATNHWIKNPIDAFILANLEQHHLQPAPAASRLTLLRRASFDLLGLPPAPQEIEVFVNDKRPQAYPELLERLLSSPHYGERWGRHWLDLARYADTGGFEKDLPYPNAWKFRDYVINSFNKNKPFARFIEEQIGGDELWPGDPEAAIATGFFTIGPASLDSALMSTQLEYEWLSLTLRTQLVPPSWGSLWGAPAATITNTTRSPSRITLQFRRSLPRVIDRIPMTFANTVSKVSMASWQTSPFPRSF